MWVIPPPPPLSFGICIGGFIQTFPGFLHAVQVEEDLVVKNKVPNFGRKFDHRKGIEVSYTLFHILFVTSVSIYTYLH
jgi:hypothetical protein